MRPSSPLHPAYVAGGIFSVGKKLNPYTLRVVGELELILPPDIGQ
jgi:hypothetical protein